MDITVKPQYIYYNIGIVTPEYLAVHVTLQYPARQLKRYKRQWLQILQTMSDFFVAWINNVSVLPLVILHNVYSLNKTWKTLSDDFCLQEKLHVLTNTVKKLYFCRMKAFDINLFNVSTTGKHVTAKERHYSCAFSADSFNSVIVSQFPQRSRPVSDQRNKKHTKEPLSFKSKKTRDQWRLVTQSRLFKQSWHTQAHVDILFSHRDVTFILELARARVYVCVCLCVFV